MNDSERDPSRSSSTLTDPENYDWEDATRTEVSNLRFSHNQQSTGTDAASSVPPPQASPRQSIPAVHSEDRSDNATRQARILGDAADDALRRSSANVFSGESADVIMMRLSNEFTPIVEKDADTLVYLGVPPQEPGQDLFDYDHIRNHFARPYLMKSETLRRVNSSKFEKFLGPMSARTERRLKKHQIHRLVRNADNIKFYIDLSPILNDEEAMTQLAELSVPKEALKWHQIAGQYGVQSSQIDGRDILNTPSKPSFFTSPPNLRKEKEQDDPSDDEDSDESQNPNTNQKEKKRASKSKHKFVPPIRLCDRPLEDEYTSLRHHTTTSRLLHAIAGNDPKLNSAAKAWSFCMLAKYFDCAQHYIISPWIEGWLLQGNNLNFIQINPCTAYRMGVATQSVWLTRCTFAVLVGKRAMSTTSQQMDKDHILRDCLDDDEMNRIDHASAALYQRVRNAFEQILSGMWMANAYGFRQLNKIQIKDGYTQQVIDDLKRGLLEYVQRRICIANTNKADNTLNDDGDIIFTTASDIRAYDELPLQLRVLTASFWKCLRAQDLSVDIATDPEALPLMLDLVNESGLMGSVLNPNHVSKRLLVSLVHEVNRVCFPDRCFSSPNAPGSRQDGHMSPENTGNISPYKARKTTENTSPTTPTKSVQGVSNMSRHYAKQIGRLYQDSTQNSRGELTERDRQLLDNLKAAQAASPLENPFSTAKPTDPTAIDEDFEDSWWSDDQKQDSNDTPQASRSQKHVQFKEEIAEEHGDVFQASPTPHSASQASASQKPDQKSNSAVNYLAIHGQAHLETGSLPFRPRKRTSDAAELLEGVQQAQQEFDTTYNPTTSFPQVYRANLGQFGITPSTLLKETATVDQLQATATATWERPDLSLRLKNIVPQSSSSTRNQNYGNVNPSMPAQEAPTFNRSFKEAFSSSDDRISPIGDVFYLSNILQDLTRSLKIEVSSLLSPGYHRDGTCDFEIPVKDVKTLLCLGEEEWKYLPLWAGGLDDGSGGVFNDGMEIPDAPDIDDGGFRGGAMGIIPGVGSSLGGSMAGSEFEDVATEIGVSTVGKASRMATEGRTATIVSLDDSVISLEE